MKDIKNNFSNQADSYAACRPHYPTEMYDLIYKHCLEFDTAWDCATGNGQAAQQLAKKFTKVLATDISERQIAYAATDTRIKYIIEEATQTSFDDDSFDMITIAQALHWFATDEFYEEVERVARNGCILAAWGYNLLQTEPELQKVILNFYNNVVGEYWDAERRYVEDCYTTLPFPFKEIDTPPFSVSYDWTIEQLTGYLNSWSSVQHYIQAKGTNPVTIIEDELKRVWQDKPAIQITFPIFLKMGRIVK